MDRLRAMRYGHHPRSPINTPARIMTIQSELAAIEVRIDWEHRQVRHYNRHHFEKINFWHDILPGALSMNLPASNNERVSEALATGELVPPRSERNIPRIRIADLRLQRKNGPPSY